MIFLRQILFNICFYGYTALYSILLTPFLVLPRPWFLHFLNVYFRGVHLIEKYVLGLDFEVRGLEHMPPYPFLVAAKHYSAYETMKLHLLFKDPAIILKKELTYIPLWGWHALKGDMIAIDRSQGQSSREHIARESVRMMNLKRPIVIFVQGTRVGLNDTTHEKPYKRGILRMYDATHLPILPLAMNSGVYWGRNSFFKKPGKVVFEFLPVIPPHLPHEDVMRRLENGIEPASKKLIEEALR